MKLRGKKREKRAVVLRDVWCIISLLSTMGRHRRIFTVINDFSIACNEDRRACVIEQRDVDSRAQGLAETKN